MKPVAAPLKFVSLILCSSLLFPPLGLSEDPAAGTPKRKSSRELPIEDLFAKDKADVETVADQLEYLREQRKVVAKGNVVLRHHDTQITADYAEIDAQTKKAFARGHVIIFRNGTAYAKGDELHYDFANDSGSFPDGRVITFPWFVTGREINQIRKNVREIKDAAVTTCNLEKPHYAIHPKKVTIYEGDKMIARGVWFKALGVPFFWWPYFIVPLQRENLPFSVIVGNNTQYGAYIGIRKGISIIKQVGGKILADWRSRRGVGGGLDLNYDFGVRGNGMIKTYLTQDKRAPTPGADNPYHQLEDRTRGRVTWLHRTDLDKYSNLQLRYHRVADEFFLRDFFEHEDRAELEQQSFVTLTRNSERYGAYVHTEKRMNDFEALVERLPEVRFDWKNQPVMVPWLYYQNQNSFSNLTKNFGRSPVNEDVVRAHNRNEWTVPLNIRDIKFTPFAAIGQTYYSREKESTDDRFRLVYGWGADLRTQFYRKYPFTSNKLGIAVNDLRHVVEPLVQYEGVASTVSDETISEFDPVDRIDDANRITFGVENRIQTKRIVRGRVQRVDIVSLNTYMSYEFHPDGRPRAGLFAPFDDGRTASNFTIWSEELVVRPYEWLQYETRFDYDMEWDKFRTVTHDLTLKHNRFRFLFGNRYNGDFGGLEGDSQFVFSTRYRVNKRWEIGGYTRWSRESAQLQEWQVAAERDMHDFVLDFGYNVRNSLINSRNRELFFSFRLKAFPILGIRQGGQRADFAEPRIGETVAGANQ